MSIFKEREFPYIRHISDVLPFLDGRSEFVIRERGWYTSVDYTYGLPKTFPEAYSEPGWATLRECRGLIFNAEGNLISRPYHKFRNLGETQESKNLKEEDFKDTLWLEKMDGSMVRPLRNPEGKFVWATRAGTTDVAAQVDNWFALYMQKNPKCEAGLHMFLDCCICQGITPIFEWCSREQRIVLDYPEPRLVLTAMRNNLTGQYFPYELLRDYAGMYGLDLVQVQPVAGSCLAQRLERVRLLRGQEGRVVVFPSGERLKVKAEDYCRLHRTKDCLSREKDVLALIRDEKLDDLLVLITASEEERVTAYQEQIWKALYARAGVLKEVHQKAVMSYQDKRDFAVNYVNKLEDRSWAPVLFELWKRLKEVSSYFFYLDTLDEAYRMLWEFIDLKSQTGVDKSRAMLGGVCWIPVEKPQE